MAARKSTDQDPAANQATGGGRGATEGGAPAAPSDESRTAAAGSQTQPSLDAQPADGGPGSGATPTPVHLMPVAPVPPPYDPALNETVPGGRYLVDDVLVNADGEPLDDDEGAQDESSDEEGGSTEEEEATAPASAPSKEPTPEARPPSHRAPGA